MNSLYWKCKYVYGGSVYVHVCVRCVCMCVCMCMVCVCLWFVYIIRTEWSYEWIILGINYHLAFQLHNITHTHIHTQTHTYTHLAFQLHNITHTHTHTHIHTYTHTLPSSYITSHTKHTDTQILTYTQTHSNVDLMKHHTVYAYRVATCLGHVVSFIYLCIHSISKPQLHLCPENRTKSFPYSLVAEHSYNLRTSGLWVQKASTAHLCLL